MYWTRPIGWWVPEVTVYFWIVKILTTAMGEATSDYMVHRIDPVYAVAFAAVAFAAALAVQLAVPRSSPQFIGWPS
jgi:uncharacterized membrane-anchored protein